MLRTSPFAIKLIEKVEEIHKGAFRPGKDEGIHITQCQAFAMSRRDKLTVAIRNDDHWCPRLLLNMAHWIRRKSGWFIHS